jgi:ligand-binding sensor domain-containing protein/serine phosphatase RsbU (regulator of sigma subunit)
VRLFYLFIFLWILIGFLIPSCNNSGEKSVQNTDTLIQKDSAFFISRVNKDTIYTGVEFELEGDWKDTSKYDFNSHMFGSADIHTAQSQKDIYEYDSLIYKTNPIVEDSVLIHTPGKDTFDVPVPVQWKNNSAILKAGVPSETGPLRRKENARLDIQYLNSESGMPSSYVSAIIFDNEGVMWMGTPKGICKYDGKFITNYTTDHGLPDDHISKLFLDSKGNIWIGTQYGGLAKYDGTNIQILNNENGLPANNISGITEDSKGNIWISMWSGGISKFDGKYITTWNREQGLYEMRVLSVEADENDQIWICTNGGGLYRCDGESIIHYRGKSGFTDNYLISTKKDSKGRMWIGNWYTLRYFDKDSVYDIKYNNAPLTGPTGNVFEDSKGNIWFATNGNGVMMYNGKSITVINELTGLTAMSASQVAEDPYGNLWFATEGGGVCRYNPNSFEYFDESAGLNSKIVNAISETPDGQVLFATDGGLVFFDDTSFRKLYVRNSAEEQTGRIYDVLVNSKNEIWFTALNGHIYRIVNDSIRAFGGNQGVLDHNVTAFTERVPGEMWLGSWNVGLSNLTSRGFTVFNARNGLHNFIITDLFTDHNHILWIATDGEGITRYDGKKFKHITINEGLIHNQINSFYEDSFNNLWVCGQKGINIIHEEKISKSDVNSILPDKDVKSVIQDNTGNYWIFTANGLIYLKLKDGLNPTNWNIENYDSKLFTQFDGLIGTDFIARSAFIDSKNRIWFGTGKGLMMKNLSTFDVTPKKPKISIETIKINGNFIDYNNLDSSLYDSLFSSYDQIKEGIGAPAAFTNYPSKLTLPSYANHLTFVFSTQSWHSDKIKFTYRLIGADEEWSTPSKDTWAEYRNLSYGDYTFQLKGLGESNAESEILEYHFTVTPPWYHTWWARIIFTVIIILAIRFVVRLRTKKLEEKRIELEQKVQERTAELDVKNKELTSQNSIIEEQRFEAEKRKEEIEKQHTLLEETHKEIKDSINYAKRIQEAILPTHETISKNIADNFILYKPKDVVAGDFYWIQELENGFVFAAADCTGHGVPGAMVSVVCYNALNRSVREFGLKSPEKILDQTREIVLETFQQNSAQVNDGMDASLVFIGNADADGKRNILFSGANNTLTIVRNKEMIELEGDKQPVGNYKDAKPFTLKEFTCQAGDIIYLFTDGYADQFGGPKGKKLKSKVLKEILIGVSGEKLTVQREKLLGFLEDWKGDLEQLDDISVFGFKI